MSELPASSRTTHITFVKMGRFGTSFNLDGIWGGNMYAGGAGAILPNKITSKHNFRYVPNMNGLDIVKKLRWQLDHNGYKDVQMKLIGDVPWAKESLTRHRYLACGRRDLRHHGRAAR